MMIKKFLSTIRSKKADNHEPIMPAFSITENSPSKDDFELTELTHEEYVKFINELRHMFRKQ